VIWCRFGFQIVGFLVLESSTVIAETGTPEGSQFTAYRGSNRVVVLTDISRVIADGSKGFD
jgi:hypothetical protein